MIWQLMKRDTVWLGMPIVFVFLGFPMFLPHAKPSFVMTMASMQVMGVASGAGLRSNCSLFEAALPIDSRDLWLSRLLWGLVYIWVPVTIVAAWMHRAGTPVRLLIEVAAFSTVLLAGLKVVRIRESVRPRWLRLASFGGLLLANFLVQQVARLNLPSAGPVLAACALASGALALWGWSTVPRAFQFAPLEITPSGNRILAPPLFRFVWSPVYRSAFGWPMWTLLALFLGTLANGVVVLAGLFLPLVLAFLMWIHFPARWLLPLPFPSSSLFRVLTAPFVAIIAASSFIRIFAEDYPLTLKLRIIGTAGELVIFFLLIFLTELSEWRRLTKVWRWVKVTPAFLFAFAGPFTVIASSVSKERAPYLFDDATQRLAAVLPQSIWLLALILFAAVALIYWLAERTFGEMEYTMPAFKLPKQGDY